jgi:hypothetical protein
MGHDLWDKLTDYWATSDKLYTPFDNNAMKRDRKDKILTDWAI